MVVREETHIKISNEFMFGKLTFFMITCQKISRVGSQNIVFIFNFRNQKWNANYSIMFNLLPYNCAIEQLLPMFSTPQRTSLNISPTDTASLATNYRHSSLCHRPVHSTKIETQHVLQGPAIPNSIISDTSYNSSIYEWRKQETAPIVKVVEISRRAEFDPVTGEPLVHNTIRPEPYFKSLAHPWDFTKDELLYIFKCLLEGHQAIFKKMKATSVSLEKSIINLEGQVKVWVNQQFQRNDISGEILSKEEPVVNRILETMRFLSTHNPSSNIDDFIDYAESSKRKAGKWTFNSMKAMVKSYCDCLKIKIAQAIVLHNPDKRSTQSVVINRETQVNRRCQPQRNSELSNQYESRSLRHPASSLNSSQGLIQDPIKNPFMASGLQFHSEHVTKKSITESQTISTAKVLPQKNKHTISITDFQPEVDPILERSLHHQEGSNGNRNGRLSNKMFISKTAFCSLPEVNCEDDLSSKARRLHRVNDSDRSLTIASQFSLQIEKLPNQYNKESFISTTLHTLDSGYQLGFSRKGKGSHMTINLDDNKENKEFNSPQRDRFQVKTSLMGDSENRKNIMGSCTSWKNSFGSCKNCSGTLSDYSKDLKVSEYCRRIEEGEEVSHQIEPEAAETGEKKQETHHETSSANVEQSNKEIIRKIIKNPLTLLTNLRSVSQIESYEKSQKHSESGEYGYPASVKKVKLPIEEKILQLLNLNKNMVVSTYMETSSQKTIKENQSPERRIRDIEETLSELIHAKLKQEQIIECNRWTKKLENLLGLDQQMKESINYGAEQACALIREIKMSKIGKMGRAIESSRMGPAQ